MSILDRKPNKEIPCPICNKIGMVYGTTYLREIADFCEELTKKDRQGWRQAKRK